MRIIHTADWHVGVRLESYERTFEHKKFFEFLYNFLQMQEQEGRPIDAILVSGDLYNSCVPSQELQKMLNTFWHDLICDFPQLSIYVIAGNHDNGQLLDNVDIVCMSERMHCLGSVPLKERISTKINASNDLLASNNLQERAQVASASLTIPNNAQALSSKADVTPIIPKKMLQVDLDQMIYPLKERDGSLKGYLAMVPFIREGGLGRGVLFSDDSVHTASECVAELCRQLAHRIEELKASNTNFKDNSLGQTLVSPEARKDQKLVSISMAHLAVSGKNSLADAAYDENVIAAGGVAGVNGESIDYFDYTALGHIHLKYSTGTAGGGNRLHYSGSPLPINFSESEYRHAFKVLEIGPKGEITYEDVLVPRAVDLIKIPSGPQSKVGCTPHEALDLIKKLPNEPLALEARPLVSVYLRSDALGARGSRSRSDIASEIRQAMPENCRLCSVRTVEAPRTKQQQEEEKVLQDLSSMQPIDVFSMYARKKLGTSEVPADLLKLFNSIVKKVKNELDNGSDSNLEAASATNTLTHTDSTNI